jgi:hypothetical protein
VNPDEREGRLGPALLVALLAASLLAGVLVYNARTPNLALEVPEIERLLGSGDEADIPVDLTFFVRYDEPEALVEIVGSEDATVRTLASSVPLEAEERIACSWDGTDDEGDPVPPGNYRVRVVLPEQDRDMVFPQRIKVRKPPPPIEDEADSPCVRDSGEVLE